MKQNKEFLDDLDGDWGNIISDTYEENIGFIAEPIKINGEMVIEVEQYLNDENLKDTVIIPEGVTKIFFAGFRNCPLTTVIFPSTLKFITSRVFENCNNLKTIIFKEGLESIDNGAFNNCTSLTNITLPESLLYIGLMAFSNVPLEGDLVIPENVKYVEEKAFAKTKLKNIYVKKELTTKWNKKWNEYCNANIIYY